MIIQQRLMVVLAANLRWVSHKLSVTILPRSCILRKWVLHFQLIRQEGTIYEAAATAVYLDRR
jgi:hypothetical protein